MSTAPPSRPPFTPPSYLSARARHRHTGRRLARARRSARDAAAPPGGALRDGATTEPRWLDQVSHCAQRTSWRGLVRESGVPRTSALRRSEKFAKPRFYADNTSRMYYRPLSGRPSGVGEWAIHRCPRELSPSSELHLLLATAV